MWQIGPANQPLDDQQANKASYMLSGGSRANTNRGGINIDEG